MNECLHSLCPHSLNWVPGQVGGGLVGAHADVTRAASQLKKTEVQLQEHMEEPGGPGRIKIQMLKPGTVTRADLQLNKQRRRSGGRCQTEPGGPQNIKGQIPQGPQKIGLPPAQIYPSAYTDGSGCQWDITRFDT